MALLVLCDARYRNSVWCDIKIKGICDEAVRRRIQPEIFTDVEQFKATAAKLGGDSSVIVLFDSLDYIKRLSAFFREHRIHPILSVNNITIPLDLNYSIVGGDIDGAMRNMIEFLHDKGKKHIALVGVGANSCNDTNRVEMLKKHLPSDKYRIFYVKDRIINCYKEFAEVQNDFDAVICPNAHVAICLNEYLKNYRCDGEKLFVLSNTDTIMARLYENGITSMTTNFYNCGRAAVENHFNRIKYGWANSRIFLPLELKVRGSTDYEINSNLCDNSSVTNNDYSLFALGLGRLERVLAASDLVNLKLIYGLMSDYNYDKMGEFGFLSADAAKYRVRKIKQALGVATKAEASSLIRKYIKRENMLTVIGEFEEKSTIIIL